MHVEKKSELRSLLKSGDSRCKLVEPRNTKSCVWRFFNLVSCDDRIEPYACCKTCGDLLSYSGKTGTGSLLRHRCLHSTPSNGKFEIKYPKNVTHVPHCHACPCPCRRGWARISKKCHIYGRWSGPPSRFGGKSKIDQNPAKKSTKPTQQNVYQHTKP